MLQDVRHRTLVHDSTTKTKSNCSSKYRGTGTSCRIDSVQFEFKDLRKLQVLRAYTEDLISVSRGTLSFEEVPTETKKICLGLNLDGQLESGHTVKYTAKLEHFLEGDESSLSCDAQKAVGFTGKDRKQAWSR